MFPQKNLYNNQKLSKELDEKQQQRSRYEEIIKNKMIKEENTNTNSNTNSNINRYFNDSLNNIYNEINSLSLKTSNNNNNITVSNIKSFEDQYLEFDSKYRDRNINKDNNSYFSFSLNNTKTTNNINIGSLGLGFPVEQVIEIEISEFNIPNILSKYETTSSIKDKRINLQIIELVNKNIISTTSTNEWKDKHFIFEIQQVYEYNDSGVLVLNDKYIKLVPIVKKIIFPIPILKIDKMTFIFTIDEKLIVFDNDYWDGNLDIGPLYRTSLTTSTAHGLTSDNTITFLADGNYSNTPTTFDIVNSSGNVIENSVPIDISTYKNLILNDNNIYKISTSYPNGEKSTSNNVTSTIKDKFDIFINSLIYYQYDDGIDTNYTAEVNMVNLTREELNVLYDSLRTYNTELLKTNVNKNLYENIKSKETYNYTELYKNLYLYREYTVNDYNLTYIYITVTISNNIYNFYDKKAYITSSNVVDAITQSNYTFYKGNNYVLEHNNSNYLLSFSTVNPSSNIPILPSTGYTMSQSGTNIYIKLDDSYPHSFIYGYYNNTNASTYDYIIIIDVQKPILDQGYSNLSTVLINNEVIINNVTKNFNTIYTELGVIQYLKNKYYNDTQDNISYLNNYNNIDVDGKTTYIYYKNLLNTANNVQVNANKFINDANLNLDEYNKELIQKKILRSYLCLENASINTTGILNPTLGLTFPPISKFPESTFYVYVYVSVVNNIFYFNGKRYDNFILYTDNTYYFDLTDSSNNGMSFNIYDELNNIYSDNFIDSGITKVNNSYMIFPVTSLTLTSLYLYNGTSNDSRQLFDCTFIVLNSDTETILAKLNTQLTISINNNDTVSQTMINNKITKFNLLQDKNYNQIGILDNDIKYLNIQITTITDYITNLNYNKITYYDPDVIYWRKLSNSIFSGEIDTDVYYNINQQLNGNLEVSTYNYDVQFETISNNVDGMITLLNNALLDNTLSIYHTDINTFLTNFKLYYNVYIPQIDYTTNTLNDLTDKIDTLDTNKTTLNYNVSNTQISIVYKENLINYLNSLIYDYLIEKWVNANKNNKIFSSYYLQNITITNIPFFINERRFQIPLRVRQLINKDITQGILNI